MIEHYFCKEKVAEYFSSDDWQYKIFQEFENSIQSNSRPFPCVFGVSGFKLNQLRFAFFETLNPKQVGVALEDYVREARKFGPNTSLVVFTKPTAVQSIAAYERKFWTFLQDLAKVDTHSWPSDIPMELDHPDWEFCFAGEPLFVVCNTPAHVMRQSRRASAFMLTLQPRWVFNGILGTKEAAQNAVSIVRGRLEPYDLVSLNPHLGSYGDPENREFAQYFLREDNEDVKCPYASIEP